jgi:nitroreductase
MSYQDRYIRHQEKKKRQLMLSEGTNVGKLKTDIDSILKFRRSQRVFNSDPIDEKDFKRILEAAVYAPNSCNRHGIKIKVVDDRREKELLSGILVGGVGWIHRAQKITLFFADSVAYASPNEKEFMHYADVGFTAMPMWLTAESLGIGCSYINPNVLYKDILLDHFGREGLIFCGALVFGHYDKDKRAIKAESGELKDMLV